MESFVESGGLKGRGRSEEAHHPNLFTTSLRLSYPETFPIVVRITDA